MNSTIKHKKGQVEQVSTDPLVVDAIQIVDTPTTSASTYHFITRNDSTGVLEKVSSETKQDTLVSGTNIKTINGTSLLGSGDITVSGGGGGGDMVLADTQTVSGLKTFLSGAFGLRNVANTFTSFLTNTVTAVRTWTFPDKDGTVAMTSDIPINTSLPINPTVINASTYTLVIGDANLTTKYTFSGGLVITLSADATTNFPIGTVIKGYSTGGTISIAPAGGVTINGNSQTGINSVFSIFKISANYWQMDSIDKAAPVFTGNVKTSGSYFNTAANMGYFGYDNASGMYFDGNYVYFRVFGGGFKFNVQNLLSATGTGNENVVGFSNETVNPTSGSRVFNFINSSPTINQTGGASGIVRSLYINPTLTSAFDFRAIEVTAGKSMFKEVIADGVVRLKSYTVATLPTGVEGDTAYVTDATAPTYLGTLTGGGSVVCPVFYNGTAWVSN